MVTEREFFPNSNETVARNTFSVFNVRVEQKKQCVYFNFLLRGALLRLSVYKKI